MNVPEVGEGIAFGIGGTNYRVALCDTEGMVDDMSTTPTPQTTEEFFQQTARRLLQAADQGAEWGVIGIPGPVQTVHDAASGLTIQNIRVTNIPALNAKDGFNPVAEMTKIDPAIGRLLAPDSGFTYLTVNDGDLAAQAAAHHFGAGQQRSYSHIADVIDGTGTGGAMVRRDHRFPGANLFHADAGLWEVGHTPQQPGFPTLTSEAIISGTALANRTGILAEELSHDDPIWSEVGLGLGSLALTFGILGGAELVVFSGGTAVMAQAAYRDDLNRYLDSFAASHNPMSDKVPDIEFVPVREVNTYELHGARGAIVSYLTNKAIDKLIRAA